MKNNIIYLFLALSLWGGCRERIVKQQGRPGLWTLIDADSLTGDRLRGTSQNVELDEEWTFSEGVLKEYFDAQDTIWISGDTFYLNDLSHWVILTPYLVGDTGSIVFVSTMGDNLTAERGNINKPFREPWTASRSMVNGDLMMVLPGTYTAGNGSVDKAMSVSSAYDSSNLCYYLDTASFYFMPGVTIVGTYLTGLTDGAFSLVNDADSGPKYIKVIGKPNIEVYGHLAFSMDINQSGSYFDIELGHIKRLSTVNSWWGIMNGKNGELKFSADKIEGLFMLSYYLPKDNARFTFDIKDVDFYNVVGGTIWNNWFVLANETGANINGSVSLNVRNARFNIPNDSYYFPILDHTGGGSTPTVGYKLDVNFDNYTDLQDFTDPTTGENNSNMYPFFYYNAFARAGTWKNCQFNIHVGNMSTGRMLFDARKYGITVVQLDSSQINITVDNGIFRSTRIGVLDSQHPSDGSVINIDCKNCLVKKGMGFYARGSNNTFATVGAIYRISGHYKLQSATARFLDIAGVNQTNMIMIHDAGIITSSGVGSDIQSPAGVNVFTINTYTNSATKDADVTEIGEAVIRNTLLK